MYVVGFIIRIYHDTRSPEHQKTLYKLYMMMFWSGYRTDLFVLIHVERAHTAQSLSYTRILSIVSFSQTLGTTNQTSRPHNSPDFDVKSSQSK